MDLLGLFLVFLKSSALTVGGLASLTLVHQDLVVPGIASDPQVVEALAIGRLSPGPNGLYLVSLGYEVAGWAGAAVATLAVSLPPLVIIPATALARRWLLSAWFGGLVRGVTLASAGLLVATGLQIAVPGLGVGTARIAWWQAALAVIAVVETLRGRLHPALLVVLGVVAGNALFLLGF